MKSILASLLSRYNLRDLKHALKWVIERRELRNFKSALRQCLERVASKVAVQLNAHDKCLLGVCRDLTQIYPNKAAYPICVIQSFELMFPDFRMARIRRQPRYKLSR